AGQPLSGPLQHFVERFARVAVPRHWPVFHSVREAGLAAPEVVPACGREAGFRPPRSPWTLQGWVEWTEEVCLAAVERRPAVARGYWERRRAVNRVRRSQAE